MYEFSFLKILDTGHFVKAQINEYTFKNEDKPGKGILQKFSFPEILLNIY